MKGMLKAEFFQFSHSHSLWVIMGVLIASCGISILTGAYNSAENTLANLSKDVMVPLLACGVYGAIILTDDFSNGLLRHYISNGYKRSSILCAKCVHYLLGCSILLLVYPTVCVSLAAVLHGAELSYLSALYAVLFTFIKSLPLYWGLFGLFFLFSVLIKKGVIVMGVSVAFSILLVVFTNKFYESAPSLLKYSPVIQLGRVSQNAAGEYFIAAVVSLGILAACLCGSIVKFHHDEV